MIRWLILILLIAYVTAVVFAPPITGFENSLRYDDGILLVAAAVALLSRLKSRSFNASDPGLIKFVMVLIYLILMAMLFSSLLTSMFAKFDYGGLVKELLRLGKYVLVVFLALVIVEERHRRIITYWIIGLGIMVVFTQIAQYVGGLRFNQIFSEFYGEHRHFAAALGGRSRELGYFFAGGPFGNPNVAGSFLIIPFYLVLFFVFSELPNNFSEERFSLKTQLFLIAALFLLFIGFLLTDSRAVIITVPIVATFYLIISGGVKSRLINIFVVILPLTILLLLAPYSTNRAFFVDQIVEGFTGGSMTIKMGLFKNAVYQLADKGQWWGFGPDSGPRVDFEMGTFVTWYGLPGLVVYLLFWLGLMWGVLRYKDVFDQWQAILGIIFAAFLVNFSQGTYLNIRVFPVIIIIILMNISRERLVKNNQLATKMEEPKPVLDTALQ